MSVGYYFFWVGWGGVCRGDCVSPNGDMLKFKNMNKARPVYGQSDLDLQSEVIFGSSSSFDLNSL